MAEHEKQPAPRWRQVAWLVLRMLFVVGVFYFIFRVTDINFADLGAEFRQVRWGFVVLGFGVWLLTMLVGAVRWKLLLDVVVPGKRVLPLFALNLIGVFYAQFLPGLVGGELAKGYYLARDDEQKVRLMSSAIVDRLLGIAVNGAVGLTALLTSPLLLTTFGLERRLLWLLLAGLAVGALVGLGVLRYIERFEARLPGFVSAVYDPLKLYARHVPALLAASGASLAYFLCWALAFWALAASTQIAQLGYLTMVLLVALVNVVQFLPISINGAGVREGAVVLMLSAYGIGEARALAFALLVPLMNISVALLGGLLVLADYHPAATPSVEERAPDSVGGL